MGKPPGNFFSSCEVVWALPNPGGRATEAPLMGGWPHTQRAACVWCLPVTGGKNHQDSRRLTSLMERKATEYEETRKKLAVVLSPYASWRQDTSARSARQTQLLLWDHGVRKVNVTKLPSVPWNWRQESGKKLQKGKTDKNASLWSYQNSGHSF